jgi:tetrahydromethanopterin S-methyltransferase subunit G
MKAYCFCFALLFSFNGFHLYAQPTPVPASVDSRLDEIGKKLEQSKAKVQELKDAWDKARLEATLYGQRAQRAYKKWVKAAKKARPAAEDLKEKAELELQLAVERRKLAWGEWQMAQLHLASEEASAKALDQEKDTQATRERMKKLEEKLNPNGKAAPAAK